MNINKLVNYILVVTLLLATSTCQAKELPSLKGRKVLIVFGGWKGHQPYECSMFIKEWLEEEGAKVDTSSSLDTYLDEDYMSSVDLIIQSVTLAEISKKQLKGLHNAIMNGAGFAGWHGGMSDSYRNSPKYQYIVGGQFVGHPGNKIDHEVNIVDKKDLVTKDIPDFKIKSEQYYLHVDPNIKVLATTTYSGDNDYWIAGSVMPVTWKKMHGKGRVFYTSIGHNLKDFQVTEFVNMLKNGIKWASASKYEETENLVNPVYGK